MGIDYTTHLGPFVECKTRKVSKPGSQGTTTIRSCTDAACSNYEKFNKAKHCHECGSKIDNITIPTKLNKVSTCDVTDEIKESLTLPGGDGFYQWSRHKNIDLWLPNNHRPHKKARSFSFDSKDDIQYVEITPELMGEEISEFIDQYSGAISILRKHYGLENVTIKWGLIHIIS